MIPVEEAKSRIVGSLTPVGAEQVALPDALGRVLAEDVVARMTQPPSDVSSMDGYAVRHEDVTDVPARLRVVGEAPAGAESDCGIGPGEAVRIFTGGPVPPGADTIVIQENTTREGDTVVVGEAAVKGRYVRPAGLDFRAGDVGLSAGRLLTARDIGFVAAMNVPWLRVRRRPRVAILSSGDELVNPGDPVARNRIISSNGLALAASITLWGGEPINLGIARDDLDALRSTIAGARGADLLVTSGGASVGERDLIREAFTREGLEIDFWKVAMRPGKPLMFGHIGDLPLLGLPGNPVSSLVCAIVFLRSALAALLGVTGYREASAFARVASDLGANDGRQDYLRATLEHHDDGDLVATPFARQDSSMLSKLARADCLIVRPPEAPPAPAGTRVPIIPLGNGLLGT